MQQSVSGNRRTPKLRAACDSCSIAKVKCDKKQPICDRCTSSGFTCSYSPSRRHGKQSWANRVANGHQSSTADSGPAAQPPNLNGLSEHSMAAAPDVLQDSLIGLDSTLTSSGIGCGLDTELNLFQAWNQSELLPDFFPDADMPMLDAIPPCQHLNEPINGAIPPLPDLNASVSFSSRSSTANAGVQTSESDNGHPLSHVKIKSAWDCEARAFVILHSLHYCRIMHTELHAGEVARVLGNVSRFVPKFDKVLYMNKAALKDLIDLLDCTCARQPHLVLFYLTILSKILFWYRLAVSGYSQQQNASEPEADMGYMAEPERVHGHVRRQCRVTDRVTEQAVQSISFKMGEFDLESEDQLILVRGVLLKEVQRMEAAVEKMRSITGHQYNDNSGHNIYCMTLKKIQEDVKETLATISKLGTPS